MSQSEIKQRFIIKFLCKAFRVSKISSSDNINLKLMNLEMFHIKT